MEKSEPAKKRLFVGTFLPTAEQASLGQLKEFEQALSEQWQCKTRLLPGQKLHLTWVFLGYVPAALIIEMAERLTAVATRHQKMHLQYSQAVFWPAARQAKLWVLTPHTVPKPVSDLACDLRQTLSPFLQKQEIAAYSPHITLARLQPVRLTKQIPDWLPLAERLPIDHDIGGFDLIESRPGSGEQAYQSLKSFALK